MSSAATSGCKSGVACAGLNGPWRDGALDFLFGAEPMVQGATFGAAFLFVVTMSEVGYILLEISARDRIGGCFVGHKAWDLARIRATPCRCA